MAEHQDIRITKTRASLQQTLLDLLEKKSFQKITVNDICQAAMVSRSTFYTHFEDKYQLLIYCLQEEREKLSESHGDLTVKEFLRMMLENVRQRERVYRNLFMADINMELIQMFRSHFQDFFVGALAEMEAGGKKLPGPPQLVAVYCSNGMAGLMMWWIENGFPVSVNEMARCQYNLLTGILLPENGELEYE